MMEGGREGGREGTAIHPMVLSFGAVPERRRIVRAVWDCV